MPRRTWAFPGYFLSAVALSLVLHGCGGDSGITVPEGSSMVTLSVSGLEPMGGGLNYQAWLVSQSGSNIYGYPLVIFNIDEGGHMVDPVADTILSGPYSANVDPTNVQGVAISLEVSNQVVQYSSFTFILSGENVQGTASLSAEDYFALNRDYSNADGNFILATPTDEDPDNEQSGIWFMDPTGSQVAPGLVLPAAPNGWIYEGWVDVDGIAVSTGKFVFPEQPDSTAFHSGNVVPPFFPGEDFLFNPPQGVDFPLDLRGGAVFITLEPWHQWDVYPEEPFFLRVLEAQIAPGAAPETLYPMTSVVGQFPSGTARIQEGS